MMLIIICILSLKFFSKGCILIHIRLATWRIFVEYHVEILRKDIPGRILTDLIFASSWLAVLFFTRKYQTKNI